MKTNLCQPILECYIFEEKMLFPEWGQLTAICDVHAGKVPVYWGRIYWDAVLALIAVNIWWGCMWKCFNWMLIDRHRSSTDHIHLERLSYLLKRSSLSLIWHAMRDARQERARALFRIGPNRGIQSGHWWHDEACGAGAVGSPTSMPVIM